MLSGFSLWLESAGSDDEIFSAVADESVTASRFNSLLHVWVKESSPSLSGVKLQRNYRQAYNTTFLSGQVTPTLAALSGDRIEEHGFSGVGLVVTPLTYQYLRTETIKNFDGIGIDNGMFTPAGRKNFGWDKYEKMVKIALAQEKRGVLRRFYFFTIPDEPFDWPATLKKYQSYKPGVQKLRSYGAPAAICVQNGATVQNVPFGEIDVIFIGGNDSWKVGPEAEAITKEAQRRHINIHMGRVNGLKRLNTASQWQVDTADGTYLMHELGKSAHDIERKNPQRPGENETEYYLRLKRILHGQHQLGDTEPGNKHLTEPEIVHGFVNHVLDIQHNSFLQRRYDAIARLIHQTGRAVDRKTLAELDRFLPSVPGMDPDNDVVEFDPTGKVQLDPQGKPVRNMEIFRQLTDKMKYRPTPAGIPTSPGDYTSYMNRYIARLRDKGVMPR